MLGRSKSSPNALFLKMPIFENSTSFLRNGSVNKDCGHLLVQDGCSLPHKLKLDAVSCEALVRQIDIFSSQQKSP